MKRDAVAKEKTQAYDCLSKGCAERGLCGTSKCNRWIEHLKSKCKKSIDT